jgi:DNA-binding MarR family transcriptional regulator
MKKQVKNRPAFPNEFDALKLEYQLCFPLYAVSRMVTKLYQPLLKELDLTYPQYLVMLVLWEKDKLAVTEIGGKLLLSTNTLTPLLQRMEEMKLLKRSRAKEDERTVLVQLTEKGTALKNKAVAIPAKLAESTDYPLEKIGELKILLDDLMEKLSGKIEL